MAAGALIGTLVWLGLAKKMDYAEFVSMINTILIVTGMSQWRMVQDNTSNMQVSGPLRIYGIAIVIVSLVVLVLGVGLTNGVEFPHGIKKERLDTTIAAIQLTGTRVAHIVSMLEVLFSYETEMQLRNKFRELDGIFEHCLNMPLDKESFRSGLQQHLLVQLTVYVTSEIFVLTSKLLLTEQTFLVYWLLYLLPLVVCGVRYFQIYTTVASIRMRFSQLIDLLSTQNSDNGIDSESTMMIYFINENPSKHQSQRGAPRARLQQRRLRQLTTIRDLYNRLWEIASLVNRCFGISLLINVGNDFISITTNCYWIFFNFKPNSMTPSDYMTIAASAMWSVPHLFNMIALTVICERTIQCRTGIALGLHRMDWTLEHDNDNAFFEQFSLQLLHQKLSFTACGFFNIDLSLLYTIVGAITTYLIILIQFHMNDQRLES